MLSTLLISKRWLGPLPLQGSVSSTWLLVYPKACYSVLYLMSSRTISVLLVFVVVHMADILAVSLRNIDGWDVAAVVQELV